jgi:hypothetical protein
MSDIHIVPAEDGVIAFAGVNYSSIHLWSRRIDSEGVAGWALLRIIDMDMLILSGVPTGDVFLWSSVVEFARDSGELFVLAESGIFMINIRSMQLRKVLQASGSAIYPYASFYTPGTCLQKLIVLISLVDTWTVVELCYFSKNRLTLRVNLFGLCDEYDYFAI